VEAYRGFATVSWIPSGGGMDALDAVAVTLDGQGVRSAITHPALVASVPVINAISPNTGTHLGGTLVQLIGTGFAGTIATTGVKFGTTNASTWWVENDNVIYAVAPPVAAGAVNVVVTNATGPSTSTATFTFS